MEWTNEWPEKPGRYWVLRRHHDDPKDKWRLDMMIVQMTPSSTGVMSPYRVAFGCIMFKAEWDAYDFLFTPLALPELPNGVRIN